MVTLKVSWLEGSTTQVRPVFEDGHITIARMVAGKLLILMGDRQREFQLQFDERETRQFLRGLLAPEQQALTKRCRADHPGKRVTSYRR